MPTARGRCAPRHQVEVLLHAVHVAAGGGGRGEDRGELRVAAGGRVLAAAVQLAGAVSQPAQRSMSRRCEKPAAAPQRRAVLASACTGSPTTTITRS